MVIGIPATPPGRGLLLDENGAIRTARLRAFHTWLLEQDDEEAQRLAAAIAGGDTLACNTNGIKGWRKRWQTEQEPPDDST